MEKINGISFTYLLRVNHNYTTCLIDTNGKLVVEKQAKSLESSKILELEYKRILEENGKLISGPNVLEFGEKNGLNYIIMEKCDKSLFQELKDLEGKNDFEGIKEIFIKLLNGISEISKEINGSSNKKEANKKAKLRAFKYYLKGANCKIKSILPGQFGNDKLGNSIDFNLLTKGLYKVFKFKTDSAYQNHSCLHTEHIFIDQDKFIAIDWEHSEKDKNRWKYLDEAYIFQNLLQYFSDKTSTLFLDEFFKNIDYQSLEIFQKNQVDVVFIKKLMGGIFEMISDNGNKNITNRYYGPVKDLLSLHQEYIKKFINNKY